MPPALHRGGREASPSAISRAWPALGGGDGPGDNSGERVGLGGRTCGRCSRGTRGRHSRQQQAGVNCGSCHGGQSAVMFRLGRLLQALDNKAHSPTTDVAMGSHKSMSMMDVSYLDGKFSLNHAAHQLKEAVEQSEGLRTETAFQKGRYRRWIVAGKPIEWVVGCKLDVALSDMKVPLIKNRGIDSLNILSLESLVIMRSAKRIYLGQVKGIYRYGSVSGKHESFTDAETVEGLSYLSLKVYEQMFGQNVFKHISICKGPELALFTHAPISELVYHLSGAGVKIHLDGTYSISAGDAGWERWAILRAQESRDILYPKVKDNRYASEDEEVEEGGKKRRPKGPRGAVKKQKTEVVKKAVAERKPHAGNLGSAGRAKGRRGDGKKLKK
ncbi:hypothetical protein B0H10DRAFT_1948034 [Mycena sp. CBHHK59/15]|nr:hypothetical protein B0H10DRAFT_1948034 [Mycena sp. CBHHK59/15]